MHVIYINDNRDKKLSNLSLLICVLASIVVTATKSNHIKTKTTMEEDKTIVGNGQLQFEIMDNDSASQLKASSSSTIKTPTPVIGILTQVFRDYRRMTDERHFHLASSYVKWIESAGAQVLPILLNQDDSYYEKVFEQTNGLLFPGGDNLLDPNKNTPMMFAAKKLYKLAFDANNKGNFYPIWGTCLGLELMSVLSSNKNVLEDCSANDISLTMDFVDRGKLFAKPTRTYDDLLKIDYSAAIMEGLKTKNLTYNFHHKCLTESGLKKANLEQFYKPLAFSEDKFGFKFIAVFEAFNYPFYGVQFHPEKPPFEFAAKNKYQNVPHSNDAILVSRYFADFFVSLAQLNNHKVNKNDKVYQEELIYARDPMYTAIKGDIYEQRYLFPYLHRDGISDEEFLDYVPDSDEEIPEDVDGSHQNSIDRADGMLSNQHQTQNSVELSLDYELVDDTNVNSLPAVVYNADYPGSTQEDADDNN